jgi:DNA mismatch repair ATPase MutS
MVLLVDKNKNLAREKLEEIQSVKDKINKQLEPVGRELKTKTVMLKKIGGAATDRQRQELKKWIDSYNSLTMKIKYIQKKEEELTAFMNSPSNYNGYLKATGTVFPGVKFDLYGVSHKDVKVAMVNKVFKLLNSVIEVEG